MQEKTNNFYHFRPIIFERILGGFINSITMTLLREWSVEDFFILQFIILNYLNSHSLHNNNSNNITSNDWLNM